MSIEEIVEYAREIMKTPEKFNKRTFVGRLHFGRAAEMLALLALERGIIENYPQAVLAQEVDPNSGWSIELNAINGDIEFFSKLSKKKEFLDVKGTRNISDDSLSRFRDDGWYFTNALVESPSLDYIIVRNNEGFQKYIRENSRYIKSDIGIRFGFYDLPEDIRSYGIETYSLIDAGKYLQLVRELKIALENVCPKLIVAENFRKKDEMSNIPREVRYKVTHLSI